MGKNLIVCCDGTGNEIKTNESNVLKFYRVLKVGDDQVAFYDPGVGTLSDSDRWSTFKSRFRGVFGLLTGYGLDANILDAYRFLIRHYREGDQVYLFGFSRGAYTVRVLAGLINVMGVLRPHQEHLSNYALAAYKRSSEQDDLSIAWRVQEVLNTPRVTVRFMGCWDTVASVIVPRLDRLRPLSFETLPFTQRNPCVQVFRHAMSIDERRCMFRLARWSEPQVFKASPYLKDDQAVPQDCKQVWFAGVHADVGGGYPERESAASKFPLAWMVDEARAHGLAFRERLVKRLVFGDTPANTVEGGPRDYRAPDACSALHDSMSPSWRALEYWPRRRRFRDYPGSDTDTGLYLPRAAPRYIAADAHIDPSVWDRVDRTDYRPPNLPARGSGAGRGPSGPP
ncbi:MAG: DUF2235 domain-containing protein [Pseudomonadota bacterium]